MIVGLRTGDLGNGNHLIEHGHSGEPVAAILGGLWKVRAAPLYIA